MKYIKNFESMREEYPEMFSPREPEDEPQSVPGFENGTIDPEDDEVYPYDGFSKISQKEEYKTIFLKTVKERNFEETETEIKINLHQLGHDYCMSIYGPLVDKYFIEFLNNELKGKYISKGFINIMENVTDINNFTSIEGFIEDVKGGISGYCDSHVNLKLKGIPYDRERTICQRNIVIDKIKSTASKYNI